MTTDQHSDTTAPHTPQSRGATTSSETRSTRRASRPLSARGQSVTRQAVGGNLVSVREAANRLGVRESTLATDLSARTRRALVAGFDGWLVDLRVLTQGGSFDEGNTRIIERGDFL